MYKIIHHISKTLAKKIENSALDISTGPLFVHHIQDNLLEEIDNPAWQNQAQFFWLAEEPFPKKSLPPEFENYPKRFFIFINSSNSINLFSAKATPWFGMPGLGTKFHCRENDETVTLYRLLEENLIQYVKPVNLTESNIEVLSDKENYRFLIDERIVKLSATKGFLLEGNSISLETAYQIGGAHIVQIINTS